MQKNNANQSSRAIQGANYAFYTAAHRKMASCRTCHLVSPVELEHCPRCNEKIYLRIPNSLQRTIALVITAIVFYIPANIYPIMSTTMFNDETPSTIISGVLLFIEHQSYFVALVIFTASIIIPIGKIIVLLWLCLNTSRRSRLSKSELSRLYYITEFIGKWSMIDIFVVAILVALVHITGIMIIEPGIASRAFAVVVILTMLAAQQFDIRLIWDKQEQYE